MPNENNFYSPPNHVYRILIVIIHNVVDLTVNKNFRAVNTCQTFPGETFKVSSPVTFKSIFFLFFFPATNVFTPQNAFASVPDGMPTPCGRSFVIYQSPRQNPIIYFKKSSSPSRIRF